MSSSSSPFGLTVNEAYPQVMAAVQIADEKERKHKVKEILGEVRALGYHDGSEEERCGGAGKHWRRIAFRWLRSKGLVPRRFLDVKAGRIPRG
jgi:hypothetical protein